MSPCPNPNEVMMKIIITTIVIAVCTLRATEGGANEDRLINHIFSKRNYNPMSRPVENENNTLNVGFSISLQQIIDVDEKNEMLHTNIWLTYNWLDWNLKWDPEEYGGLNTIRLPSKQIWTPDILLYNSADQSIDSKLWTNVIVSSDGSCTWIPIGLYTSSCSIDIKWFPFDDQFCRMKFGSWTYDGKQINLSTLASTIEIGTYQKSGEWKLLEVPAIRNEKFYDCCPDNPYFDITYLLHIRRRTLYYGFNLIIPCALISLLSLLTFILPPDAGEKIGLGVTILLSLSVFQTIVADMVPPTSMAVPLAGVYFVCVMIMSTISVTTTVVVLWLHHSTPEMCRMPTWVRTGICEWLAWMMRMSRPGKELTLEKLLRKASVRELEEKMPPSQSLLANVEDIDNTIQLNQRYFKYNVVGAGASGGEEDDGDCFGITPIRNDILLILNEIRFITRKLKEDTKMSEETSDWKFAAMVVDRMCFWVFSVFLFVATLSIFFSAPNFFDNSPELTGDSTDEY